MTVDACADLVERGDPDRFLSAMTAAPEHRGALMVLYAFNLEVARAPWVTKEPMIAEMRLQWWADAVEEIYEGKDPRKHEVVTPLAALIRDKGLDRSAFGDLIQARRFDIYPEPHADEAAFDAYVRATAGGLMWLSSQALGASGDLREPILQFGYGAGLAALFRAVPALKNAQKAPLVASDADALRQLAGKGLSALDAIRAVTVPSHVRAALRSGWLARGVLKRVQRDPAAVFGGGLEPSEFERRFGLMTKAVLNRY